jgi:hypothetical protein
MDPVEDGLVDMAKGGSGHGVGILNSWITHKSCAVFRQRGQALTGGRIIRYFGARLHAATGR